MNRYTSVLLLTGCLTLICPIASPQDSAHREKVAEGEYSRWQDGHPLKNTELTWTVWRTNDDLEVEAKLPPNMAAFWAVGLKGMATPELRKDIQESSVTTTVDLQLTKQIAIQKMILEGKSLADLKQVRVADCRVSENGISCKGRQGTERLRGEGPHELVYSYPFPLLFTPMLRNHKPVQNQATLIKLVMLEEVHNKLQLTEVSGQLHAEGAEKLTIGEYGFDTEKYLLVLAMKAGERKITLWTKNHDTVFAMEDSMFVPGLRIMLSQYKRYSDF